MENCILNQTEKYVKFDYFLFRYFKIKRIFKKMNKIQEDINIYNIPFPEKIKEKSKKKYCTSLCSYLKKCGIKKVCLGTIKDTFLKETIKKEFRLYTGISVFEEKFKEILLFFAKKKGYQLKDCEICFISNYPEQVKKYLLKCIKNVKKIAVFTTEPEKFNIFIKEIRENYGILIERNEKVKKYNHIYINLEEKPIFHPAFFKNVSLIDVYYFYKNAYNEILFFTGTEKEGFLKEKGLTKTISLLEYLKENTSFLNNNHEKIVNIKKYD